VKTLGRSRRKFQEASEDFTQGEILFPGPKTTYMEANAQNHGKKCSRSTLHALGAWSIP